MKSIRFKLWSGMMTLVAIVLVLLWLTQIVFLERFYTELHVADIQHRAEGLTQMLVAGDAQGFTEALETLAFNNNLSAEVLDGEGRVYFATDSGSGTGRGPMMMMNSGRDEVFHQALRGAAVRETRVHPRFGNPIELIGIPVKRDGTVEAVLVITLPMAPVDETAAILKQQLLYITAVLIAAALGISFFLARGFSKPILDIKAVAERMAAGDYTARATDKKHDEIGMLADTINDLGVQLTKTEQLRKDFIANVSHELRTPLSLIRGYAETIRDVSGNDPGKRERQLGVIIEESERLGGIVDDILNLSQLQSGIIRLEQAPFDIHALVRRVSERYGLLSEQTGIRLEVNGPPGHMALGDAGRIEQVLYNLINNAFNHTPDGGLVTVTVTESPDRIRLSVQDTGPGIPEAERGTLWQRYYVSDRREGKRTVGTGLGLAIVKEIYEAHDIPFGIDSILGEGSIFWFELRRG